MANSSKGTAQQNPPTPKQRVVAAFGSKDALVDELVGLTGGGDDDRARLRQVSNLRLMKHLRAAKQMAARFGSKDGLVEAILAVQHGGRAAPEGARERLEAASAWKLLDLHRQSVDLEARRAREAAVAAAARAAKAKRRAKVAARRAAR